MKFKFFHLKTDGSVRELTWKEYQRLAYQDQTNINKKTFARISKTECGFHRNRQHIFLQRKQLEEILEV